MGLTECKAREEGKKLIDSLKSFKSLSIGSREVLAQSSVIQKVRTEQHLWQQGDSSEYFACVVSGLVEICRPTARGKDHLMGVFGPGDIIGMSAFLQKMPFPGTAKSLSPHTKVLKFYIRHQLQNKSSYSEEIAGWIREMFLLHEQILRDKIDILTAGSVENRIFEFLLHLRRRFGVKEGHSKWVIPLQISKTQVAKIIDARPETVFRTLSSWKGQGLIQWLTEKIVILNIDELEQQIDETTK